MLSADAAELHGLATVVSLTSHATEARAARILAQLRSWALTIADVHHALALPRTRRSALRHGSSWRRHHHTGSWSPAELRGCALFQHPGALPGSLHSWHDAATGCAAAPPAAGQRLEETVLCGARCSILQDETLGYLADEDLGAAAAEVLAGKVFTHTLQPHPRLVIVGEAGCCGGAVTLLAGHCVGNMLLHCRAVLQRLQHRSCPVRARALLPGSAMPKPARRTLLAQAHSPLRLTIRGMQSFCVQHAAMHWAQHRARTLPSRCHHCRAAADGGRAARSAAVGRPSANAAAGARPSQQVPAASGV